MEANITHPTDLKSLEKVRDHLVKIAKKPGIELRQTYSRTCPNVAIKVSRYAHAKQFNHMHNCINKIKKIIGRVVRDIEQKMEDEQEEMFKTILDKAFRLLGKEKDSKNKPYSVHTPEAYCISKGKAHKKYEYGCKVDLVVTHK